MSLYVDNGASNSRKEPSLRERVDFIDEKVDAGLTRAAQRTHDAVSSLDPSSAGANTTTTSTTSTSTTTKVSNAGDPSSEKSAIGTPFTRTEGLFTSIEGTLSGRRYADRPEGLDMFGAEEEERAQTTLEPGEPRMSARVAAVAREVFGGGTEGKRSGGSAGAPDGEDEAEKASVLE